jgi:hypothetical protein
MGICLSYEQSATSETVCDKNHNTAFRQPMAARDQARWLPHHCPQDWHAGEALQPPGNDLTRRFPLIVETLARRSLSGQPGHADVGPGWLQLGVRNARSSFGVSNAFTLVQKIDAALRGAAVAR